MTWFIYLDNKSLKSTAIDISEDDLKALINLRFIQFIEKIIPNTTIGIYAKKFRIKTTTNKNFTSGRRT